MHSKVGFQCPKAVSIIPFSDTTSFYPEGDEPDNLRCYNHNIYFFSIRVKKKNEIRVAVRFNDIHLFGLLRPISIYVGDFRVMKRNRTIEPNRPNINGKKVQNDE